MLNNDLPCAASPVPTANFPKFAQGVLEFCCSTKKLAPTFDSDANDDGEKHYGKSELTVLKYAYPLKFFFPDKISAGPCAWVYPVQFGGGLVPGDQYLYDVTVGADCCVLFASQSSTKVFSPTATSKGTATQSFKWTIRDHGFLSVLSDAVVPHRDSSLQQFQEIHLDQKSNLVFLDWFTAGRIANKELWEFQLLQNTLHVYMEDKLILKESLKLSDTSVSVKDSMKPYNVYGTCIILGPRLTRFSKRIYENIEAQKLSPGYSPELFLATASPLYQSPMARADEDSLGCILRFCSTTTAGVYSFLENILSPLFPLYGANPFHLK